MAAREKEGRVSFIDVYGFYEEFLDSSKTINHNCCACRGFYQLVQLAG